MKLTDLELARIAYILDLKTASVSSAISYLDAGVKIASTAYVDNSFRDPRTGAVYSLRKIGRSREYAIETRNGSQVSWSANEPDA